MLYGGKTEKKNKLAYFSSSGAVFFGSHLFYSESQQCYIFALNSGM